MIQGYAVNKKRLEVLNKTIEIQTRMLASSLYLDEAYQNTLSSHIKTILTGNELDVSTIEESSVIQIEGKRKVKRTLKIYNLDIILAIDYRIKSPNGIIFRKWVTSILKDYMIQGYDINKKRLEVLNKTVEIQTRMLASSLDLDEAYQNTLSLL